MTIIPFGKQYFVSLADNEYLYKSLFIYLNKVAEVMTIITS